MASARGTAPVGHAEHDIQIAQTAVAVNQQHFAAKLRESRAYARCKGGFSCAALTGRNKNHLQHTASERKPYLRQYCTIKAAALCGNFVP